jgi:hypothetical protein
MNSEVLRANIVGALRSVGEVVYADDAKLIDVIVMAVRESQPQRVCEGFATSSGVDTHTQPVQLSVPCPKCGGLINLVVS